MPIEIRELVIKAVVDSSSQRQAGASGSGTAAAGDGDVKKLEAMMQQMMEVLKENKNER